MESTAFNQYMHEVDNLLKTKSTWDNEKLKSNRWNDTNFRTRDTNVPF